MDKTKTNMSKQEMQAAVRQMEEDIERCNMTFDAFFRLLDKIGTTFDMKETVSLFILTVMGQLKLRKVSLYLNIPGRRRFESYHALGIRCESAFPALDEKSAFVTWIGKENGPVHIDGFFNRGAAGETDAERLNPLIEEGFAYAFPLNDDTGIIGILFFGGKVTGEKFSEFDNELLRMMSKVAIISIKNARLYRSVVMSKRDVERFSKVKQEFINHTSHELRTPLTVLKSTLWSVATEDMEEGLMIDMAKDAVTRLHNNVEHILALNEMELDRPVLNLERTEVSSIIEDCLREVIPEVEEKRVAVNVDDRARYREIMADVSRIRIVLRSIINNAVDFVKWGGRIDISTSVSLEPPGDGEGVEIRDSDHSGDERFFQTCGPDPFHEGGGESLQMSGGPESHEEPSYLVIRVRDDGIGIPRDEIKSIVEPFKRSSNSTVRNVKGLGIGLSVSQRIIAGHGGRLFCNSDVGTGAEFSIWLPFDGLMLTR